MLSTGLSAGRPALASITMALGAVCANSRLRLVPTVASLHYHVLLVIFFVESLSTVSGSTRTKFGTVRDRFFEGT